VEIRLDLEHGGSLGGFSFEVLWGATSLLQRSAIAGESRATVRADGALTSSGAQLSHQSWGSALAFAAGAGTAPDSYAGSLVLDFRGALANSADTLTLRGYSVIRIP
jgi:hypothetical protein